LLIQPLVDRRKGKCNRMECVDVEMPPFGARVSVRPVIKAADGIATAVVYAASFHAGPTTTLDPPKPFLTRTDDASFDF
jgi:hypothetical protein